MSLNLYNIIQHVPTSNTLTDAEYLNFIYFLV